MSPELIGILGVGLALAGLLLRMHHHTDKRIDSLSGEMRGLSERVARLAGLFEGSGLFRSNQPAAGDLERQHIKAFEALGWKVHRSAKSHLVLASSAHPAVHLSIPDY